jgi:hypothetical protein
MARPSKFDPKYVEQVRKLSQDGWTDKEIADFLQVSLSTFYLWAKTYPEFSDAIKLGKEPVDNRVERSLLNRALGYTYPSVKVHVSKDKDGNPVVTKVPVLEHVPPDVTACIFWLKNRRREQWRDKHDHEIEAGKSLAELVAMSYAPGMPTLLAPKDDDKETRQ